MDQPDLVQHYNTGKYLLWELYTKLVKLASSLENDGVNIGTLRTSLDEIGMVYDNTSDHSYEISDKVLTITTELLAISAKAKVLQ